MCQGRLGLSVDGKLSRIQQGALTAEEASCAQGHRSTASRLSDVMTLMTSAPQRSLNQPQNTASSFGLPKPKQYKTDVNKVEQVQLKAIRTVKELEQ